MGLELRMQEILCSSPKQSLFPHAAKEGSFRRTFSTSQVAKALLTMSDRITAASRKLHSMS